MRQPSINKITRPTLTKVLPRKRLFRVLDKCRRAPIVWVTGPPGSGKTTLVASFLDSRKLPCLWYQVDEGDADISTFFYYMGQAAKKAAPRKREPLPLLTPEYRAGIPTFTQRYFENLCSRLKPPYLIVFDNYQEVHSHSPFHEIIRTGLAVLPASISAVVISRSEPPLALTSLLAGNKIALVGWDELRLTAEESRGIALLHLKDSHNRKAISWMHEKVDGWAAGLILLSKFVTRHAVDTRALTALAPEQVFDYFSNELFDKQDEGIRKFLLKTSVLPRITPPVAEQLTANKAAAQILADLNRRNYFTDKRLDRELSYQYHPLFREFLINRANKVYSAAALAELHLTGARLLKETGQIEDAAGLFIKVESWADLTKLILSHARALIAQGRNRTLEEWIDCIPLDLISHDGWLLYWKGICRFVYGSLESRQYFEQAFDLFRTQRDAAGIFLAWSGVIEATLNAWSEFISVDRWIGILDDLLQEEYRFPSQEIEIRVVMSMFIALTLRQPHHRDMKQWLDRALNIARETADIRIKSFLNVYLELYYLWKGDHAGAESIMRSIESWISSPDAPPLARITGRTIAAVYYVRMADHRRCMEVVREGLAIGAEVEILLWNYLLYSQAMNSFLLAGDYANTEAYLQKMGAALNEARRIEVCMYYNNAAWFALVQGDVPRAARYAEKSLQFALEAGTPMHIGLCHSAIAQVFHEQGEHRKAAIHMDESLKVGKAMGSSIIEFMAFLCRAYFSLCRGEESASSISLRKAMTLGREQGYVNTYWWRPDVMSQLCAKALEDGIEVEYVRDLIRKRNLVPDEPPLHIDKWPWPTRIFTLGKFEVRKDDEPLVVSRKVQKKPLQLLKALIAAGGKEVREDYLTDTLWPNAEGDAAYKALGVNIIRLRRLLGTADAVVVKEGCISLDPRICWVDVRAFEKAMESAECRVPSETVGRRETKGGKRKTDADIAMLEKALDLYKGPFLADDPEPWSVPLREKLRDKFLQSIEALGEYLELSGTYKEALRVYQRGLDVDDLAEMNYQRMMSCYSRLGRNAEALAVYNRCKKTFAAYGVEPSEETEALRYSLRRQE